MPRIRSEWALCVVAALSGCRTHDTTRPSAAPPRASTTTTTRAAPPKRMVEVSALPRLSFADPSHGWRVEPVNDRAVERTADGGRSWARQLSVPVSGTGATGVFAIDSRHAFALVFSGTGILTATLERTTDGVHWSATPGRGLSASLAGVSFVDATHGWGETRFGDLFLTTDGGERWRAMPRRPTADPVQTLCAASPETGWVATRRSVYRTDDGGTSWRRQFRAPYDAGDVPALVCSGGHVAFASFGVGAGQHIGAFVRSDDGGEDWRPLTEDATPNGPTLTAPGFPDSQIRGDPIAMFGDGTLVFASGCYACEPDQNGIVVATATDRFSATPFDGTAQQIVDLDAVAASDPLHLFVEIGTRPVNADPLPLDVMSLGASDDGGRTWRFRRRD